MIFTSFFLLFCNSIAAAMPNPRLSAGHQSRQEAVIQADSPLDHRWITNIAALGESYMAGQGAGHEIKGSGQIERNPDCNQFSWSFPVLLNSEGMLGDNSARKIQHLACSGAKADDVLNKQIPKLRQSQLIMLSVGGNDAHLAAILNYCIYQWSLTLTWSCGKELEAARKDIESQAFFDKLNKVMDQSKAKLIDKNSRIIWTGYERFFSVETKECDRVTWGSWYKIGFREYLTQARRKEMNDLVDSVNHIIKGVCDQHDECIFIDSNKQIDNTKGHFCEPGVDETYENGKGNGANREETWFYEWDTTKDNDSDGEKKIDQPQRRQDGPVTWDDSTFEGAIVNYISQGLAKGELDPTINFLIPTAKDELSATSSSWYRVFHRTKYANGVIAMNILRAIEKYQAEIMQQPVPVTSPLEACHNGPDIGKVAEFKPLPPLPEPEPEFSDEIICRIGDGTCQPAP